MSNVNVAAPQAANVTAGNTNVAKTSILLWKEEKWSPLKKERNGVVTLDNETLGKNRRKTVSRIIFIDKKIDLFQEDVPSIFVCKVIEDIESASKHIFIAFTEHAERMAQFFANRLVPKNLSIWVKVDNSDSGGYLRQTGSIHAIVAHKALKALNG